MTNAGAVIWAIAAATTVLAWVYARQWTIDRPPVGVVGLVDVAVLMLGVVVMPYLYLWLPVVVVSVILGMGLLNLIIAVTQPVLGGRWAVAAVVGIALLAADVAVARVLGPQSYSYFAANDLVMAIGAIAAANLWVQGGLKAWHAVILGLFLATYDALATTLLPLTTELFGRLGGIPFAPMLAWRIDDSGRWLGLGLGDLLFAALVPPLFGKAFRRGAGLAGMAVVLGIIGALLMRPSDRAFPVMVILGPAVGLLYAVCMAMYRRERTMWEYLQGEPLTRVVWARSQQGRALGIGSTRSEPPRQESKERRRRIEVERGRLGPRGNLVAEPFAQLVGIGHAPNAAQQTRVVGVGE